MAAVFSLSYREFTIIYWIYIYVYKLRTLVRWRIG